MTTGKTWDMSNKVREGGQVGPWLPRFLAGMIKSRDPQSWGKTSQPRHSTLYRFVLDSRLCAEIKKNYNCCFLTQVWEETFLMDRLSNIGFWKFSKSEESLEMCKWCWYHVLFSWYHIRLLIGASSTCLPEVDRLLIIYLCMNLPDNPEQQQRHQKVPAPLCP